MGKVIKKIFGGGKMPKVPEQKVVPMADEQAIEESRRKSVLAQKQRGGRQSTILSGSEKLGA